jgi:stage II sporulation protein R
MKKLISVMLIVIFASIVILNKPQDTYAVKQDISNKLIRLHVIANSDSEQDQRLKLKVRDAVIMKMNSKFMGIENVNNSENLIKENLSEIQNIAQDVVYKNGKDYKIKAMYGKFDFPTKYYGTITLPAGNYKALRIIIGNGAGKNWWCVMFPPLCFVDITHGLSSNETKEELKKYLSNDEIEMIETNKPKMKFKIAEIFQKYYDDIRMALK